ncbi:MAG: nucleotidyltransferase family protein, partial [Clostridia bacterium]|nr:nucleotidyltransferase family protein [Clostridia bacterium]
MKVSAIIAEYNPFHNGHKYHIEETKRRTDDSCVMVIMSGNFVQRGEPAIIEKRERARAAILGGADLVVELPVQWATASA